MTQERGWTAGQAATLLLVSGGLGYGFYLLGGWLGERYGRRDVLVVSGLLVGPLNLALLLSTDDVAVAVLFFLVYQATNGTWSGAGYAYQAESFPTRLRGTAVGWMGSMMVGGQAIGSVLWGVLSGFSSLTVTWLVIAVGIGFAQGASTFLLPRIAPGRTWRRSPREPPLTVPRRGPPPRCAPAGRAGARSSPPPRPRGRRRAAR